MGAEVRDLTLTVSELCLLAGVLGSTNLIGIDDPWPDLSPSEIERQLKDARASLEERGWIAVRADERIIIEPWLADLVSACAFPEVVGVMTHSLPQYGQAQRYFHMTRQMAVELGYLPGAEHEVRLRTYAAPRDAIARILATFRLGSQERAALPEGQVPRRLMGTVARLALDRGAEAARAELSAAGVPADLAAALAATFAHPLQNGSLAVMAPVGHEWKVDGLGLLEGANGLWHLGSDRSGSKDEHVNLAPASADELRTAIESMIIRFLP